MGLFGKKKEKKDTIVTIDDIMIVRRDSKSYRQVSYWEDNGRYSTIVDADVELPEKGCTIEKSKLVWTGKFVDSVETMNCF